MDEQPVTTINGTLDVHIYDIERIEALAGPQGTLYGASAESGVVRIITNKPRLDKVEGGVDVEGNLFTGGSAGGRVEGFYNQPLTDKLALRVVGYGEHVGGYIDNIDYCRTYPTSGVRKCTTPVGRNLNTVDRYGGRAALRWDVAPNWTILPTVFAQETKQKGQFLYEQVGQAYTYPDRPPLGDLKTAQFAPNKFIDSYYQAAMTITGKIAMLDVTYAGSWFQRKRNGQADYADYSYFYDTINGSGAYFKDAAGNVIDPSQITFSTGRFDKQSHELRIATPTDLRVRGVAGVFYQRQQNDILERYAVANLDPALSVEGYPGLVWLTKQKRVDRDYAAFADVTIDVIPDKLTVAGGMRFFLARNTLVGFNGYGDGFGNSLGGGQPGTNQCPRKADGSFVVPAVIPGTPCTNILTLGKDGVLRPGALARDSGHIQRANIQYKFDADKNVYFTYSRGFRPGGINRRAGQGPYQADFLDNFELGFKTSWFDRRLRVNGAFFYEKWENFQFSFLGANGLTEIQNGPNARILGVETDFSVVPVEGLTINGAVAYTDSRLEQPLLASNLCPDPTIPQCVRSLADKGDRLPTTPLFKANVNARYEREIDTGTTGHIQFAWSHQSSAPSDIRRFNTRRGQITPGAASIFGVIQPYDTVDLAIGGKHGSFTAELFATNLFDDRGETYRTAQCSARICGGLVYVAPVLPRQIGIRGGYRF